jgi:hypothetical protein
MRFDLWFEDRMCGFDALKHSLRGSKQRRDNNFYHGGELFPLDPDGVMLQPMRAHAVNTLTVALFQSFTWALCASGLPSHLLQARSSNGLYYTIFLFHRDMLKIDSKGNQQLVMQLFRTLLHTSRLFIPS